MIAFGEYGLGRELVEYMHKNEIWTWLWFNPESYACEIIGFDVVNDKVIIYNGVNFNYEVVRTLEIKDFIEEYGDTLLFCVGKYNVSWRKVGYTLKGYKEYDYRKLIKNILFTK